jgi:molybdate transport system ATP-binding protein
MSVLDLELLKRRRSFTLEAAFAVSGPGVIAVFGRSGSGKSTLLNLIAGLERPDAGHVRLGAETLTDTATGVDLAVERRRIGYVFQEPRLFPHLSVAANLRYGEARARGAPRIARFPDVVELLGLAPFLARQPHRLSGGERQRVALGRALLSQPRLLLLDEPLASLDQARREEVLPYLEALRDQLSIPMVYVSHQFEEVLRLATYLVVMDQGCVRTHGTVTDVALRPEFQAVAGPELTGAVLEGTVTAVDPSGGTVDLRVGAGTLRVSLRGATPGARVRLQVLAREVILATQAVQGLSVRNVLPGTVASVSMHADEALVRVDIGGASVLSSITAEALRALDLKSGDRVWALFKAVSGRGHAFTLPAAGSGGRAHA